MHPGDRGVRHLFGPDHVFGAHLDRVAPDRARDLVNGPLDRKASAGAADPAIGTERRLVGRHGVGPRPIIRDRVRPRQAARRHVGFLVGPLRPHPIGAGIDDDVRLDAEHLALSVGIGGDPVMVVAGMRGGLEMLGAVLDPAHRMVELQRECRQDDLLGVEPRLRPEPAADIGRDDPDGALVDAEDLAKGDPHGMRGLGRGIDHDLVQPMVAIGEHRTPFERRARLPVHAVAARHRDLGRACSRLDVATFDRPLEVEIVAPLLVDEGGAAAHLARGVDHRRQHLEIDR